MKLSRLLPARRWWITGALGCLALLAGCRSVMARGAEPPLPPPSPPTPTATGSVSTGTPSHPEVTTTARETAEGAVALTVVLYDYHFRPETVEVPAGAKVTLTVVNRAHHEHAWVLMEKDYTWEEPFDAEDSAHGLYRITVDVLGRDILTFTAPPVPGEYNVVCSIVGHVEHGMVGKLIVR